MNNLFDFDLHNRLNVLRAHKQQRFKVIFTECLLKRLHFIFNGYTSVRKQTFATDLTHDPCRNPLE